MCTVSIDYIGGPGSKEDTLTGRDHSKGLRRYLPGGVGSRMKPKSFVRCAFEQLILLS